MSAPTDLRRFNPQLAEGTSSGHLFARHGNDGDVYHPLNEVVVTEATTARTLTDADHGRLIVCSAANTDITVPAGLRSDFRCRVAFTAGSGDLTIVASSTTINTKGVLDIDDRYGVAEIIHLGSDVYLAIGDLAAS